MEETEQKNPAGAGTGAPPATIPAEAKPPKAELVTGNPVTAIIPRTIEEVARIAKAVLVAGLAPDSYKGGTNEDMISKVMIGIMKGAEVGLPPITALASIAIINGRPCIWGDGAVALVQARNVVDKIEVTWDGGTEKLEQDGKEPAITDFPDTYKCVYKIWRKGHPNPVIGEFSVRDAKRAHLWANPKKDPWLKYPKRMLFNRARAWALRDGFADCLSGLSIMEEVLDLDAPPPAKTNTAFLDDRPGQLAIAGPNAKRDKTLPAAKQKAKSKVKAKR